MKVRIIGLLAMTAICLTGGWASAEIGSVLGDVNADGIVNADDVQIINQLAVGVVEHKGDSKWAADVNQDGVVDLRDAEALQSYLDGKTTKDGKAVPIAAIPAGLAVLGVAAIAGRRLFR
jgi:hypothetical protein